MGSESMRSFIAYLVAFSMTASIAAQALTPVVSAAEPPSSQTAVEQNGETDPAKQENTEASSKEEPKDPAPQENPQNDKQEQAQPNGEASAPDSQNPDAQGNPAQPGTPSEGGTPDAQPGTPSEGTAPNAQPGTPAEGTAPDTQSGTPSEGTAPNAQPGTPAEGEAAQPGTPMIPLTPAAKIQEQTAVLPTVNGGAAVSIHAAAPIAKDVSFTVSVSGEKEDSKQVTLKGNADDSMVQARFRDLPDGSYEVTVSAPGFATYTQSVTVQSGMLSELTLYTAELRGYSEAAAHPGVLRLGDTNGDGKVSKQDVDTMLEAMKNGSVGVCDLNGDGEVNLIDLEYLASSLTDRGEQKKDIHSTVRSLAIQEAVKAEAQANVSGNLDELLNGSKVSLAPSNGDVSDSNPIRVDFHFAGSTKEELPKLDGMLVESPNEKGIAAGSVLVTYVDENGQEQTMELAIRDESARMMTMSLGGSVTRLSDGSLQVNFGNQIAVKKITLTITDTQSNNLAEISKVEFVNGMENRIPAPEMDIPQGLSAKAGDKRLTLSWNPSTNVTAYELEITGPAKNGSDNEVMTLRTTATQIQISSINNKKLINNREYTIKIQSLNGSWKSGWSDPITAVPKVSGKPEKPDNVEAVGGYRSIEVSWKNMDDTDSYTVLYQPADGSEPYKQAVTKLERNRYKIEGLTDNTEYRVVVYGTNDLGDGPQSTPALATTRSLVDAWMPSYRLINTPNGKGQLTAHIKNAQKLRGSSAKMMGSTLDKEDSDTALGVLDSDQSSYYYVADWDDGVHYGNGGSEVKTDRGIRVTFDQEFEFGAIAFAEPENGAINQVRVNYLDKSSGEMKPIKNIRLSVKMDKNNRRHFYAAFDEKIVTDQLQLCTATGNTNSIKIAELRFYGYDSLYSDIMNLYEDVYHTELKPEVDEAKINELQTRLNTPEQASGECHPEQEILQREIDTARKILGSQNLNRVIDVKPSLSATAKGRSDSKLGFTGLNDWQPLGVTVGAGESFTVYVGHPNKRVGDRTDLKIVFTQYNAESGKFMQETNYLKIGENVMTAPAIVSKDFERGGSVYIRYTGSNQNDQYGVRVDGGTKIPMLDLYQVTDEAERLKRTKEYVEELEAYVANLSAQHDLLHQGSENANINKPYKEEECILGATELLTDRMLFSVSAKRMLAGLGGGSADDKARKLNDSMQAMDDMMVLFYQHKGLTDGASNAIDQTPSQHLNIRYMRMFAGAFMYASGNHIGIGWGSVPGMAGGVPVKADAKGKYQSGNLFGWGIGHEIGHDINQGSYVIAEVTNNYFAQLANYKNGPARFTYDKVYDKVTSNTVGRDENLFTQLAMFWQLRLAYDNYYPYKTFDTEREVFDNLFFARVDTFSRTPSRATEGLADPKPLKLTGDAEQNFIRLSSAAAQKDLSEFFTRWGWIPTEETKAFIGQWPKETRAIFYGNDAVQSYRIENPNGATFENKIVLHASEVTLTQGNDANGLEQNQVKLDIRPSSADSMLFGYEISRTTISGGAEHTEAVGFVPASSDGSASFTDTVTTINNRTFTYQITPIDQYLVRANSAQMKQIKIAHDGSHDKSGWTLSTNMVSDQDTAENHDDENPDSGMDQNAGNGGKKSAIGLAADNRLDTTYNGTAAGGDAQIEVQFNRPLNVTGFKLSTAQSGLTVEAELLENGKWTAVSLSASNAGNNEVVYFTNDEGWIRTGNSTALRLTFKGAQSVSLSELSVLGPTGDNVEHMRDGIGILKADYVYDKELYSTSGQKDGFIPKDSVVFMGTYKGNPAYNAVILYDENGKIVGANGTSEQIILAPVPDKGDLGTTSDGRWVYWIAKDAPRPKRVRAELYRVDDALTNKGQRHVSDTEWAEVPGTLPELTIASDSQN